MMKIGAMLIGKNVRVLEYRLSADGSEPQYRWGEYVGHTAVQNFRLVLELAITQEIAAELTGVTPLRDVRVSMEMDVSADEAEKFMKEMRRT